MKHCALGVSALNCSVFQKFEFSRFSTNRRCFSIDQKCVKIFGLNLLISIGIRSMLDRSKLKNFQFLNIWPIYFFASFMFRIHMHCIVFYIYLAVLQSYLSLFSHIPCIHFAKLGTQLDLKIDWLIFESFVHFTICYFYVCTAKNIFLKRYDG